MYNKEDFDKIRNNPFATRQGQKMWEKYPDLKNYRWLSTIPREEFNESTRLVPDLSDLDQMLRFVVLLIERYNNPLSSIRNLDKRMEACYEALGVAKHANIKTFIEEDHFWWREVMFEYFCYCNDDQYELWFSQKMQYRNNMKLLRTPLSPDAPDVVITSRNKISQQSEAAVRSIQELEYRLFGDEMLLSIINSRATATSRFAEKFAQEYVPVIMPQFE